MGTFSHDTKKNRNIILSYIDNCYTIDGALSKIRNSDEIRHSEYVNNNGVMVVNVINALEKRKREHENGFSGDRLPKSSKECLEGDEELEQAIFSLV